MVWDCSEDDLGYASQEVEKLLALHSEDCRVVYAGRELEWDRLATFAAGVRPTIFHFIGHGDAQGQIKVREGGGWFWRPAEGAIKVIRAASSTLEGVYLNACFSGTTGPELLEPLLPTGGWAIGTTSAIDDDLAAVFAENFYRHLRGESASPEKAYKIARAYAEADWTMPNEVSHSAWFSQSPFPPVSEMAQDVNRRIRAIFSRPAFTTRMRDDASMQELDDALQDVSHALGTGEVLSRRHQTVIQSASFPPEWLEAPEIQSFLVDATRGLIKARSDLAVLKAGSPSEDRIIGNVLNFDSNVPEHEWMLRVNKVDRARNQILEAANKLFVRRGVDALRPIDSSFSRADISAARSRAGQP